MTRKRLNRIWREIEAARKTLPKLSDLEDLAKMCGRKRYGGGKHPMWMSTVFPRHRAFPIPHHGGNPIASYAVRDSVLDQLEVDAAAWEEALERDDENGVSVNGDGDGTR